MKNESVFPLSKETEPNWDDAMAEVKKSKDKRNGKVVDVRKSDDGHGNPVGIIVMDEPI